MLGMRAFGDIDVLVAQQIGRADGRLRIVRNLARYCFRITISISTVRLGRAIPKA